eukprot:6201540-Pleurochrysis_carterae.AAC.2
MGRIPSTTETAVFCAHSTAAGPPPPEIGYAHPVEWQSPQAHAASEIRQHSKEQTTVDGKNISDDV